MVYQSIDKGEYDVREEAGDDTIGDTASDRHQQDGQEGRHGLGRLRQIDMPDRTKEKETCHDHHRSRSRSWDSQEQRSEEKAGHKTQRNHKGCETCATSLSNTSGALYISSHCATTKTGTSYRAQRITRV